MCSLPLHITPTYSNKITIIYFFLHHLVYFDHVRSRHIKIRGSLCHKSFWLMCTCVSCKLITPGLLCSANLNALVFARHNCPAMLWQKAVSAYFTRSRYSLLALHSSVCDISILMNFNIMLEQTRQSTVLQKQTAITAYLKSEQLLPFAVALQQCSCTDLGWTLVSGDKVTSIYTQPPPPPPPPSPATTAYSHISIHQTGTVQTATFVVNEPGNMAFGDLLSADPVCITHGLLPGFKPEVIVLSAISCPVNTRRWNNAVLMLGQRRRRWANIKTALFHRLVFAGCLVKSSTVYCRAKAKGSICLLFK